MAKSGKLRAILSASLMAAMCASGLASCAPSRPDQTMAARIEDGNFVVVFPDCIDGIDRTEVRVLSSADNEESKLYWIGEKGRSVPSGTPGYKQTTLNAGHYEQTQGDYSEPIHSGISPEGEKMIQILVWPSGGTVIGEVDLDNPSKMLLDQSSRVYSGSQHSVEPPAVNMNRADLCP